MDREQLKQKIIDLVNNKKLSEIVKKRIKEFEETNSKNSDVWFNELCFCLLTANSSAKLCLKIQKYLERVNGFQKLPLEQLTDVLKRLGHRYYNKRAEFIFKARKYSNIKNILASADEFSKREWLVKNIKGLGFKESSHFLRNVGYKNLAILDKHILQLLNEYGIINEIPKQLSPKRYISLENELRKIGSELSLSLAELDLFMWYSKTGVVLK